MTDKTDKTIAVLVVEDYPGDLTLMRQMLASAGPVRFEIIHASNLSSAIAQVGSGPDIVLLDLNLPDSQDLNTLRSMRAAAPTTPIIIMTGMSDRRKAVKALANGAQDYLVKGRVDVHLLMRAILRHLPAMTAGTRDSVQRKRSAAITRAGSGLGRDIALGLAAKGYRIFGTAMSSEEIADLKQASGGAVTLSQCDITAEAAVRAWASEVATQNEGGLDLLISNAGILTPGPLEVLPLSAIRHEFEVNVFGALAVVNAFLPALRKARGRIVQVTTMTATQPFPFNGPSVASKAAFDAFAAVYRAELKPFGIDVVWRKLYEMFYQAIPDARAEVLDVVAEGDKVVVVDRFGGTHRGELFGRPGTGNHIEWTAIHTCTIRDGKVLEDAIMMDAPAIMQQLGLVPSLTKAAE